MGHARGMADIVVAIIIIVVLVIIIIIIFTIQPISGALSSTPAPVHLPSLTSVHLVHV